MGGKNPYIESPETSLPEKNYKIFFEQLNLKITVDPKKIPYGDTGLPGSILDIVLAHGVELDHACGGVCACSTCHVYVKRGLSSCSQPTDSELDMLDNAPDLRSNSRLACQCVPNGAEDLNVEIPDWNRNRIREGK